MHSKKILLIAASTVIASSAATGFAASADALPVSTLTEGSASSEASPGRYSDRDVLAFLTSGSGRIAHDHPEIQPFESGVAPLSDGDLTSLLEVIGSTGLDFHRDISEKLQTGNAYATLDALDSYSAVISGLSTKKGAESDGTATGDCVVVVAAGLLVIVAVAVKLWTVRSVSPDDNSRHFAADLATVFAK